MADAEKRKEAILIAEDDVTSRMVMEGFISKMGYEPISASNGKEAWDVLQKPDAPALALIDWEMPEMDGLEVVRKIRAELPHQFSYLIMVTGKSAREEIIEGISQGADDYVVKPFDSKELGVRIRAGLRIVELQRELVEANRKLDELAKTDGLTGFYNRLALHRDLKQRFEGVGYSPPSVTFIMADIDFFKRVNDDHGHDAGDAVLKQFADRVRRLLRQGDIVCRMGGEEFLLIAPETDEATGKMVAERVRKTIAERPFLLPSGTSISVTCSLGMYTSIVNDSNSTFDEQIKKADKALYQSKTNGRNRVTVFVSENQGGLDGGEQ